MFRCKHICLIICCEMLRIQGYMPLRFVCCERPDGQPCVETQEFNLVGNMFIAVVDERYKDAAFCWKYYYEPITCWIWIIFWCAALSVVWDSQITSWQNFQVMAFPLGYFELEQSYYHRRFEASAIKFCTHIDKIVSCVYG